MINSYKLDINILKVNILKSYSDSNLQKRIYDNVILSIENFLEHKRRGEQQQKGLSLTIN